MMSASGEVATGTGVVALNVITWTGLVDGWDLGQKILTAALTLAGIIHYVHLNRKQRREDKNRAA